MSGAPNRAACRSHKADTEIAAAFVRSANVGRGIQAQPASIQFSCTLPRGLQSTVFWSPPVERYTDVLIIMIEANLGFFYHQSRATVKIFAPCQACPHNPLESDRYRISLVNGS